MSVKRYILRFTKSYIQQYSIMAHIERIIEEIEQSNPPLLTWTAALIGSITVGLSGVVPIALLPLDTNLAHTTEKNDSRLSLVFINEIHYLRDCRCIQVREGGDTIILA